nr:MAG: hypothetical protein [Microvirus sp.]
MFPESELTLLNAALDQSLASNKRMQATRPQFHAVWKQMETDLLALKLKINTPAKAR